ncbi:MAG: response regulator [Taibaiella sp.]|jgi:two-component system, OmpR family, response regulator|nr:response regulator [Taibaiella sp.]
MAIEQSNRYIFLVDDEPIQNEMLKDYISERFMYQIKTYEDGETVLADMHLNPEIIVLDFHLNSHRPDAENGVDVLKKIKAHNSQAQVIMLSGQDKLEVAIDSMKHGAYDYVVKGETAFSRMENILNNINELSSVRAANNNYKKVNTLLYISLVVVIGIAALLLYVFRRYQ